MQPKRVDRNLKRIASAHTHTPIADGTGVECDILTRTPSRTTPHHFHFMRFFFVFCSLVAIFFLPIWYSARCLWLRSQYSHFLLRSVLFVLGAVLLHVRFSFLLLILSGNNSPANHTSWPLLLLSTRHSRCFLHSVNCFVSICICERWQLAVVFFYSLASLCFSH